MKRPAKKMATDRSFVVALSRGLDVLRALQREPEALQLLFDEIADVSNDLRIASAIGKIKALLAQPKHLESQARNLVETFALLLQTSLMTRHAPTMSAEAFIATRLNREGGFAYGTLPAGTSYLDILRRAWPLI